MNISGLTAFALGILVIASAQTEPTAKLLDYKTVYEADLPYGTVCLQLHNGEIVFGQRREFWSYPFDTRSLEKLKGKSLPIKEDAKRYTLRVDGHDVRLDKEILREAFWWRMSAPECFTKMKKLEEEYAEKLKRPK